MYSGLGATLETGDISTADTARDRYLREQMHALAISIYQARQRNDAETVKVLLGHFTVFADEYRERGAIGVSPFDTFVLKTGEWVEQTIAAVPGAIAAPLQAVGAGLIQGLIPFAVLAAGFLYFKGKL